MILCSSMDEPGHFASTAPRDPSRWRVRTIRVLMRAPPLRSARVRRQLVRAARAARRRLRHLFEARGSDRLSRPSLYGMTDRLLHYLPAEGGFFVEAGAFDGFNQSNTYWLERFRGWQGVLIEPVPELYAEALRERPQARVLNFALVPPEDEGTAVKMRYGGLFSLVAGTRGSERADRDFLAAAFLPGIDEEYELEVPGRTLSSVLDEVGVDVVDFLSLDVNGFEPHVLRGLDLRRHAPRFMLLELDDQAARSAVEEVIGDRYTATEWLSPHDLLYARRDQASASRLR